MMEDITMEDKTFEVYLSEVEIKAIISELAAKLNEESMGNIS